MTLDEFRLLYRFNSWANNRVLDSCASLSADQFVRDLGSSFPSVRDTLGHIAAAEWIWHERWHGRSPSAPPPWLAAADYAAIRSRTESMDRDLLAFLSSLSAPDFDRVLEYTNLSGKLFSDRLDHTLLHLVNHGTYHRGQIATLLRQLGAKPLATDLIAFHREQSRGVSA